MSALGLALALPAQNGEHEKGKTKPAPAHSHHDANTTAGRATHKPLPDLPPLFAWKFVKMGNEAFVAAKKHNDAPKNKDNQLQPKLLPRPAGGGRYICAVVVCADMDIDVAPLLGLHRKDVLVIRSPGPFVSQVTTALLDRTVAKERLSLVLLLSHQQCDALRAPDKAGKGDALDRRRKLIHELATRNKQRLRDALLHHQRELLLASSDRMRDQQEKDELRVVPGVVDERTGRIDWRNRRAQELPMSPVK